ncbi:MAG: 2-oxo acid dehydrogenase subunit E2 [Chloroflexi bacterium]|nr:2-oxo acid dehydrogenase subunit E2 [Chloroflexota bacterium]
MTEGTVTSWYQADGAYVRAGEPLYQLETDKVNLTVDAPESGTLQRVVGEGETVPVGAIVGRLLSELSDVPQTQSGVGRLPSEVSSVSRTERSEVEDVRATPAARALARRLGVDLRSIANGRRLREADVLAHARLDRAAPIAGRRKVIAERMRASLAQTAQLTVSMEVDMTEALRFREQLCQLLAEDRRPTITDLVLRATVLALREHPMLNATLVDGRLEVHPEVNIGLAVDADDGLLVPVLKDAHLLDLADLPGRTRDLAARARGNALHAEDVRGGTFTITSLGPLGVDFFTPILNPPQVAILGIGRVFTKLVLERGTVEERQMLYLNLSFDHQAVDGAPAARFLQAVKRILELPAALVVRADA